MSDDGNLIAFLNGLDRQLYVVRRDASGFRKLTSLQEKITEAILSGDGHVAFAATAAGRLLRIDIATAFVTEIVPATPTVQLAQWLVARGGIQTIGGSGLVAEPGGVHVTVSGASSPILATHPESADFQVPWELPDGIANVEVDVDAAGSGAFVPGTEVMLASAAPSFFSVYDAAVNASIIAAAHQDFSSLLSTANPAQPGEIVHVYGMGLGPVNPAVPTGILAPIGPLSSYSSR
jgi:uncharacterized protein (TIGR03437 family)